MGAFMGGIPVQNPDDITEMERDKLYELFKKRFIGMTEEQIDQSLRFDERASDFINDRESRNVLEVRAEFEKGLVAFGIGDKMDDFIAYYAAKERRRGVVPRQVCWQAMHCRTREELKEFYLANDVFEPLMKQYKLKARELKRITKRCLEKGAEPSNGYFNYALKIAAKLKDKKLLSKLMRIAIAEGHYESTKKLAEARKKPLVMRELKMLAAVILETKIGRGHTHWYDQLFIDHPELKLGPKVVDALLNVFWRRKKLEHRDHNRDWWLLNDILRYAEMFNRPLTINEKRLVRDRLWLEHHVENKKKALEIAYELGMLDKADGRRLIEMRQEQFYKHLRDSEFDQAATLGKELGIEMTSRELYAQKRGQMRAEDKQRLHEELVKKLVEEVGLPSEPAPAPEAENRTIH